MAETDERRRCTRCNAWLAADHSDELCSPCQAATAGVGRPTGPPDVPPDFWQDVEVQAALSTRHMGRVIRAYRQHPHHGRRGLTQDDIAAWAGITQGQVSTIESPTGPPINRLDRLISWAQLLGIPEQYLWFKLPSSEGRPALTLSRPSPRRPLPTEVVGISRQVGADVDVDAAVALGPDLGGIEAIELLRHVEASDVGPQTLTAIADAIDGLCRSFSFTAPADLLVPLRAYQNYLARLLDGRVTLAHRRELLRHAGWLSLLAATASMDVGHDRAAEANFAAAAGLAREVDDLSLSAWVLETRAWQALTRGEYSRAAGLCRDGLDIAPPATAAHVQLCTQAARVSARLGNRSETLRHVDESIAAVDDLPTPGAPEHHFTCDRQRVLAFCAAALVWLDDDHDIAEDYARRAVAQFEPAGIEQGRPHQLATARMNLALHLARRGEPEEAAHLGSLAFQSSWRLCHTDLFLADDLDRALTGRYQGDRAVAEFHDRYLDTRGTIEAIEAGTSTATADHLG